jgi:glycosyltransferase involved in cell wall biosynthesis
VEHCDLVLYKDESLVEDYGKGRDSVKGISDPGFSERNVISREALAVKIGKVRDSSRPIEALYFGRFVEYKGVDHMIQAVARANDGGPRVRLHLWGFGPEKERLIALAKEQLGADAFEMREPVPYGDAFFKSLREFDLSLAAPLSVDTPRSTWDSIASGVPVLAYDTQFYRGMAKKTGCVDVVEWPSPNAMGDRLREYADDRELLAALMEGTVEVAQDNTQDKWLGRRVSWTNALLD